MQGRKEEGRGEGRGEEKEEGRELYKSEREEDMEKTGKAVVSASLVPAFFLILVTLS